MLANRVIDTFYEIQSYIVYLLRESIAIIYQRLIE